MENQENANAKRRLIDTIITQQKDIRNRKYGELIIQSNEIQLYLILYIKLTAIKINKKLSKDIEKATLGSLINYYQLCIKTEEEKSLVKGLSMYNESRNSLAHKMFTEKKLTDRECEISIELGDTLLIMLKNLIMPKTAKYGYVNENEGFLYKS